MFKYVVIPASILAFAVPAAAATLDADIMVYKAMKMQTEKQAEKAQSGNEAPVMSAVPPEAVMAEMVSGQPLAAVKNDIKDPIVSKLEERIQILEKKLERLELAGQMMGEIQLRDNGIEAGQANALARDMRELGAQVETIAAASPSVKAAGGDDMSVSLTAKGLEIKNASDDTLMRVRGYLHADYRAFLSDEDENGDDAFDLRRARLIIEGEADDFYYQVSPEFGGASTQLYDAYVGYKPADYLDFRIGKFKSPLGLEQLRSTTDLTFVENSLLTQMAPSRDIGVQAAGNFFDKKLTTQIGVFNGAADDVTPTGDDDDNKEIVARIFAEPVKGIGFGVGGSWGEKDGAVGTQILPSYRTPGRLRFFQYGTNTFADGAAWRIIPQTYLYRGPFSLMGEYAISAQEVQNAGSREDLENTAWAVQAGWVLTGEDAGYKSVTPANPFAADSGGWGAWEIAGRYGRLDIDDDAFPTFSSLTTSASEAQNWGLGLNGYLTDRVRVQLDYEETSFEGGAAASADRETEKAVISRVGLKM